MGGKVGLKGTDGIETLEKALKLGAKPVAPALAVEALKEIVERIELITYPGAMGEDEAREAGLKVKVIGSIESRTTADDTKRAAKEMRELVDLILFAGGDGTARDVCDAVDGEIAVLGIPAGVKMFSACFAISAKHGGKLAQLYLRGLTSTREAEVMDIDEEAFRNGRLSAKLYGFLKVPYEEYMVQSAKAGDTTWEADAMKGIALEVLDTMEDNCYYILGPGTTIRSIAEELGFEKTLLGVDIVYNQRLMAKDVNEREILSTIDDRRAQIIVTVIGEQGSIFGRGNQQISAEVIKRVGKKNIIVVAPRSKMLSLDGRPLLADTGDEEVNRSLDGYITVIMDYYTESLQPIKGL
jgi:predicted polyphosphate/ATP-dependent NAD kinase